LCHTIEKPYAVPNNRSKGLHQQIYVLKIAKFRKPAPPIIPDFRSIWIVHETDGHFRMPQEEKPEFRLLPTQAFRNSRFCEEDRHYRIILHQDLLCPGIYMNKVVEDYKSHQQEQNHESDLHHLLFDPECQRSAEPPKYRFHSQHEYQSAVQHRNRK